MCRVFLRLLRPKFKIKYNKGNLCLSLDGLHHPNAKGCFVHNTIGVSIIEHMQWLSVSLATRVTVSLLQLTDGQTVTEIQRHNPCCYFRPARVCT
jgi:hypothetical protein